MPAKGKCRPSPQQLRLSLPDTAQLMFFPGPLSKFPLNCLYQPVLNEKTSPLHLFLLKAVPFSSLPFFFFLDEEKSLKEAF